MECLTATIFQFSGTAQFSGIVLKFYDFLILMSLKYFSYSLGNSHIRFNVIRYSSSVPLVVKGNCTKGSKSLQMYCAGLSYILIRTIT